VKYIVIDGLTYRLPDAVNYVAQQADGSWFAFVSMPERVQFGWKVANSKVNERLFVCRGLSLYDWRAEPRSVP